jgi:4-hydroxybenzoate polyprenyltransferase
LFFQGYRRRMWAYLSEMFPIPGRLVLAVLLYLAVALFVADIAGVQIALISWFTALGVWSAFAPLLILRLMDELKDRDIDALLFPERPLPSGRVEVRDLGVTLVAVGVLYLGANAFVAEAFFGAAIVMGWSLLMFKRFFMPQAHRASLPLTLMTHNPIFPLIILHLVAIGTVAAGRDFSELPWSLVAPFIVMVWLPNLAWELARKIRSPEEETSYVTYSQILGSTGAVVTTAGVQAVSVALGVYLFAQLSLSWIYVGMLAAAYAVALWGFGRFLLRPSPETSGLRPYAEVFVIGVLAAQIVEFGLRP